MFDALWKVEDVYAAWAVNGGIVTLGYTIDMVILRTIEGRYEHTGEITWKSSYIGHNGMLDLDDYRVLTFEYVVNDVGKLNVVCYAIRIR